jgi:hypothetical protein
MEELLSYLELDFYGATKLGPASPTARAGLITAARAKRQGAVVIVRRHAGGEPPCVLKVTNVREARPTA